MSGARRRARAIIFQALYEIDSSDHNAGDVINHLLKERGLSEENSTFVRQQVSGVIRNKKKLDESIKRFAPTWPVNQLTPVDRNILRLAIFEILIDNRIPISVSINEAVELAKKFGSDSSARFVNGVLSSVSAFATA
jgi:N utilization substance protein B